MDHRVNRLLRILHSTIDAEFVESQSNAERVKFFYEFLKNNDKLPQQSAVKTEKDEARAVEMRKLGNFHFVRKDYIPTLTAYNEALCLAPAGSESLGIIYANRSAIYFDTGFYQFCLENIKLALENNYPDKFKGKLQQRKEQCELLMKKNKDAAEIYGNPGKIELSYSANKKIPFMIDGLECVTDEKYGRKVVTKRNLKPGDVVLLEDAFVKTVRNTAMYSNCYNCALSNFYNLKPCPKSTKVMFCSEKCAEEAWERHYKFEWSIIDGLYDLLPMQMISLRTTLKAFTMVEDPAELAALIESIDGSENAFQLDFTQATERDKFRAFYCLATNEENTSKRHLRLAATGCAIIYHMLKEFTDFNFDGFENLFLELFVRCSQIDMMNTYGLPNAFNRSKEEPDHYVMPSIGELIFPLASLINHSCAPNVDHFSSNLNGKFGICVLGPINAGEQLFISYGPRYTTRTLQDRQEYLKEKYYFDCDCLACKLDFPVDPPWKRLLTTQQIDPLGGISPICCTFDERTLQEAKRVKQLAAKYLIQFARNVPCREITEIEDCLIDALHILVFKKPLDLILAPKM